MIPPPYLEQCIAEQMRHELASRRLEVVLVPSPVEHWPTDRQRRVVCERNPAWYREFCRQYPANRSRPRQRRKHDTLIKRQHTLRALAEIENGRLESEYAKRVYPFVEKAAKEYVAAFARERQRQPAHKEHRHEHSQLTTLARPAVGTTATGPTAGRRAGRAGVAGE